MEPRVATSPPRRAPSRPEGAFRPSGGEAGGNIPSSGSRVILGRIGKVWGLKGGLLFHRYNPDSRVLGTLPEVEAGSPGGTGAAFRLVEAREMGSKYVVRFDGVDSPERARTLVGLEVSLPREALPEPEPGEWYVSDLVGCKVVDEDGRELGPCTAVFPTGSNEVLVVGSGKDEIYVALTDDFVAEVDLEGRRIQVRRWEEI